MAKQGRDGKGRIQTGYPGVYGREARHPQTGKEDVAFYIRFRLDGRQVEERAGWRSEGMTPARANAERARRVEGMTPTNAERREREVAAKRAEDSRWTLDKLWAEYAAQRPAGHSHTTDTGRYQKHLAPVLGDKEPGELVTLDADRLRVKLLKSRSPQTAKHVLALLKRIIRFGVRTGLIDPPSPRRFTITMPSFDGQKTETLSDEQLAALLKAAAEDENWKAGALVQLALATGMRKSEMLRLRWEDVDFATGFITLGHTKAGKVQRVPLNALAREVLEGLPTKAKAGLLFPGGSEGEPVKNLYPSLRRIRQRAGLPDSIRPLHAWRHVFASRLATSGESLYVVQKILRHADPRMTQRYSHLADEALVRAAEKAGQIMSEAQNGKGAAKVINLDDQRKS